jgi:hypothetical protein
MATSGNPEFAIANIFRDLGYTFLASPEFSPFMPKAVYQQVRNLGKQVMSPSVKKALGEFYVKFGGSTDYLSSQGHLADLSSPGAVTRGRIMANNAMKALGYLGNMTEEAVRLAHMQQALRNQGITDFSKAGLAKLASDPKGRVMLEKAVYAASNVLDFRKGGSYAKAIDLAVPFFNPAVQGASGVIRAFRDRPTETALRAAQIVGLGAFIAYHNRKNNEKMWDSVSDTEKETKMVIDVGASRKDKDGNERHMYIAPAIDQGWRPFFLLGQMIAEKEMGKEVDAKKLISSITRNYSPYDVSNLPPVIAAMLSYSQNQDFWRGEKIWKGAKVSPEAEQKGTTPEVWRQLGESTGLSPERLRVASSKLMPENPLKWGAEAGFQAMFGDKGKEEMALEATKMPFIRKMLRSTSGRELSAQDEKKARTLKIATKDKSTAYILNELDKKQTAINTIHQKNKVTFDKMIDKVKSGEASKADVYREAWKLAKQDPKERVRILRYLKQKYPKMYIVAPSAED